ncbi:MAG: YigZ family protein [Clostridiales Family XIII bacterium]|nr:YigZ family protein [Clostridiales Family XIII bacterium]
MEKIRYLTLLNDGEAEYEVERSRFIGYARPVSTEDEAKAFFDEIRKRHRQATHNVPAYVLGEQGERVWCSDDGEPSGTSGAPIAHMLAAKGITDAAVIVTRYFGGVKLGTGGLVRAYTHAAELAIKGAVVCKVTEKTVMTWVCDYSLYSKVEILAKTHAGLFEIANPAFTSDVQFEIIVDSQEKERAVNLITANAPPARLMGEKLQFLKVPIDVV